MTKDEKLVESILLKERWALIQKKTECKSIKISGSKIFVNNKLHGEVKNSCPGLKTSPRRTWIMHEKNRLFY